VVTSIVPVLLSRPTREMPVPPATDTWPPSSMVMAPVLPAPRPTVSELSMETEEPAPVTSAAPAFPFRPTVITELPPVVFRMTTSLPFSTVSAPAPFAPTLTKAAPPPWEITSSDELLRTTVPSEAAFEPVPLPPTCTPGCSVAELEMTEMALFVAFRVPCPWRPTPRIESPFVEERPSVPLSIVTAPSSVGGVAAGDVGADVEDGAAGPGAVQVDRPAVLNGQFARARRGADVEQRGSRAGPGDVQRRAGAFDRDRAIAVARRRPDP
jgi:hypothetical protein